ncbi:hypothetical protein OSTOST_12800, partial [Ostertagia ostertagi]
AFGSDGTGPTYIEIIVDCTIGFLVIIIFVVLFATIVVRRRREEAAKLKSNPAHGADVSPHKDTDGPARKGSDNRPREDHTPDSRPREDSTLPDTRPREDSTPPDAAKPDGGGGGAGAPSNGGRMDAGKSPILVSQHREESKLSENFGRRGTATSVVTRTSAQDREPEEESERKCRPVSVQESHQPSKILGITTA